MKPQPVIVKLWDMSKRVVSTGMSVAGQITNFFKTPENAHARFCFERFKESIHIHNFKPTKESLQCFIRIGFIDHRAPDTMRT